MAEEIQFDNPNDIDSLTTLKIQTASGIVSPHIFANGRNQLPIEITVKAVNSDNKPLRFSKETWIRILNLRFAESDISLNLNGNQSWCFTALENEFAKEFSSSVSGYSSYHWKSERFFDTKDALAIIILYVYTVDIGTRRIAVSVDTDNGKHFTTADIASGAEKMFVTINAMPPINYGDKRNLTISEGAFVDISSNLGWTSRLTTEGPYKEHYNGTCKRRIVGLSPNPSTTGQMRFVKHEIIYEPIRDSDLNDGNISWSWGIGQPYENCFAILKPGAGYPCAVIGRGLGRNDFQMNLWYSRQNSINIDGQVYVVDRSYYYRFCPYVKENHFGDDEEGSVTFLLYKFTMPENNTYQWKWHDQIQSVTVKVTDNHGNNGMFKVTFDSESHFDTVGLV